MTEIKVREGEDITKAIRRFRRRVSKHGTLKMYKRKRYYMKPSTLKKIKKNKVKHLKKIAKLKRMKNRSKK